MEKAPSIAEELRSKKPLCSLSRRAAERIEELEHALRIIRDDYGVNHMSKWCRDVAAVSFEPAVVSLGSLVGRGPRSGVVKRSAIPVLGTIREGGEVEA